MENEWNELDSTLELRYRSLILECDVEPTNQKIDISSFNLKDESGESIEECKFMTKMNDMRQSGQLCDLNIKVGNQNFKAHKLVLCSQSAYFHTMLNSNFIEATQDSVELKEIDSSIFGLLLDLMYGESLSVHHDQLLSLINAADMLCFDSFLVYLRRYLNNNWSKIQLHCLLRYIIRLKPNLKISLLNIIDFFFGLNRREPEGATDVSADFIELIAKRYFCSFLYFDKTQQNLLTLMHAFDAALQWALTEPDARMSLFKNLSPLYLTTAIPHYDLMDIIQNKMFTHNMYTHDKFIYMDILNLEFYTEFPQDLSDFWCVHVPLDSPPLIGNIVNTNEKEICFNWKTYVGSVTNFNPKVKEAFLNFPKIYVLSELQFCIFDTDCCTKVKVINLPKEIERGTFCIINNLVLLAGICTFIDDSKSGMWLYKLSLSESDPVWVRVVALPFYYMDISLIAKDHLVYIIGGSKNDNSYQNTDDSLWENLDTLETGKMGDVYVYNTRKESLKFLKCLDFPTSKTKLCFREENLHVFPKTVKHSTFIHKVLNTSSLDVISYECNNLMHNFSTTAQLLCLKTNGNEMKAAWLASRLKEVLFFSHLQITEFGDWVDMPLGFMKYCSEYDFPTSFGFLFNS